MSRTKHQIAIANRQSVVVLDEARVRSAVERVLAAFGPPVASVSVAVVDDREIHELNRAYLQHDYPTDVLSFLLDASDASLDGEVIVSAETAANQAANFAWSPGDELLLYVIHGTLHLVGFDDQSPEDAARMRNEESRFLREFGLPGERGTAVSQSGGATT